MQEYIDYIKTKINNIEYIFPDTYTPLYQILSAFLFGLLFGPFHYAYIYSFAWVVFFEYIFRLFTRNRKHLYIWEYRIASIFMSIVGVTFSKFIWHSNPRFTFLVPQ